MKYIGGRLKADSAISYAIVLLSVIQLRLLAYVEKGCVTGPAIKTFLMR